MALRKEYVQLVDSVREYGGDVKIFSSLHVSGERKYLEMCRCDGLVYFFYVLIELEQLTGVAAILRFPMPELDDEESETEE